MLKSQFRQLMHNKISLRKENKSSIIEDEGSELFDESKPIHHYNPIEKYFVQYKYN